MLKASRVGTSPDVARLAAALARPGSDPRIWQSLAVAKGESFVDTEHGVFVDVILLPTLDEITARVPSEYAGAGFGFYAPIHKDDMIVVGIPSGDPQEGAVVTSRMWNGADPPPQDAKNNPNDVLLLIEKDKNVRLKVQGGGNINLIVADGMINLGSESPNDFVALAQLVLDLFNALKNWLDTHTHPSAFGPTSAPTSPSPQAEKPAAKKVKAV